MMNPIVNDHYLCDAEVHIFNNRIYMYGSQDEKNGTEYCPLDYICYSCDINDFGNFKYEGVIYHKNQDPLNTDGTHSLYAPDVVMGNDGLYYLYYGLSNIDSISVAKSDNPAGPFSYYGTVQYPNGIDYHTLDHRPYHFDPSVINDDGRIILSLGFSVEADIPGMGLSDQNNHGCYVVEMEDDMLTMKNIPNLVIPGYKYGKGTSFEGHEFLEAASLRKYNDTYYLLYSSKHQHELCYATSKYYDRDYVYQGILISNASKLSDDDILANNYANNHGCLLNINDDYYIFYHRHTYHKQFSRQVSLESIKMQNGLFTPAKITSSGLNPLSKGTYDASIACELYDNDEGIYIDFFENGIDKAIRTDRMITDITNTTIVYRYFNDVSKLTLLFDESDCKEIFIYQNNSLIYHETTSSNTITTKLNNVDKTELKIVIRNADHISLKSLILD